MQASLLEPGVILPWVLTAGGLLCILYSLVTPEELRREITGVGNSNGPFALSSAETE
jgi:hypothetical protein